MNALESEIQWFLARDGKQHGPVSDAEMSKLVELGHLKPTDLVWRAGFTEWRTAISVFPSVDVPLPAASNEAAHSASEQIATGQTVPAGKAAATPAGMSQQRSLASSAQHSHNGTPDHPAAYMADSGAGPESADRSSWKRNVFLAALVVSAIGGGWLAFQYRDPIARVAAALQGPSTPGEKLPTITAATGPTRTKPQDEAQAKAAERALSVASLDAQLQERPLWKEVKKEFPEWYSGRVEEAARLRADGRPQAEITRQLVESLVALRRQNARHALAADAERHKALANAFLANLNALSEQSGDACYEFISKGETAPPMLERLQSDPQRAALEAQVLAVIQAISNGRKSPVKHVAPSKKDYDMLAAELTRLGWSTADMQLFANPKELAKAPPSRVCNMLRDWFTAHLAISKSEVQQRLLFETLKPVVSG